MKFDELDVSMRGYEKSLDQTILPDLYMAARLDGRNFSRLTKEICSFEAPFDVRFRDMMAVTVRQLMDCGFRVVYGFAESDEISLLFHPQEVTFGRKIRKFNSILAGTASAAFSMQLGQIAVFDCRMIPLPNLARVRDYFRWRQEDAHRNALNAHCYWLLRKGGMDAAQANAALEGKSIAYKNELLFDCGINFNDLPAWQKRGFGVYWDLREKRGFDPVRQTEVTAVRRALRTDFELPLGDAYADMVADFLK